MRRHVMLFGIVLVLVPLLWGYPSDRPNTIGNSPGSPPATAFSFDGATPQVLVGQPPDWEPLPNGCSPEQVTEIVLRFVDAFNRGDTALMTEMFDPLRRDADGTPDASDEWRSSGWFSVRMIESVNENDPTGLGGVDAFNDEDMVAWTRIRHERGERWTLHQLFMGGYWWIGGVNISFDIVQEADNLPTRIVGGKGALDCDDGIIVLWNMGGPESIPDGLFGPGPTSTPGFG